MFAVCWLFALLEWTNTSGYRYSTSTNTLHEQSSTQVLELKMQQLELNRQIELLQRDTVDLNKEIESLRRENLELDNELKRYKNGVFFGIGFGFNYFTSSPPNIMSKTTAPLGSMVTKMV